MLICLQFLVELNPLQFYVALQEQASFQSTGLLPLLIRIMLDNSPEQVQLNNQYLAIRILISVCSLSFQDLTPDQMKTYEETYGVNMEEIYGVHLLNRFDLPRQIINSKKLQYLKDYYPQNRALLQPYELTQRTSQHQFWCWVLALLKEYVLSNASQDIDKFRDSIQFLQEFRPRILDVLHLPFSLQQLV